MERAAGVSQGDAPQAKLDKLDAALARSSTSEQDAALFSEMLSLPNDGRHPALELDSQQRRQRLLKAITSQVVSLAGQNPVLMIFEDVHWIDPTSWKPSGAFWIRFRDIVCFCLRRFGQSLNRPGSVDHM